MPQMNLTTKTAKQVWASPDGQRKIYELDMEFEGKPVKAKTYSEAIATVGWSGMAETYEKTGRNGVETFVKQVPKESMSGSGKFSGGKPQDQFTMYLSYAKDIVVAHIAAGTKEGSQLTLEDSIAATIQYGNELYDNRPGATDKVPEVKVESIIEGATPITDEDLSTMNDRFGPPEK